MDVGVPAAQNAESRPSGGQRGSSPEVLVVDDEPDLRRITARILLDEGYSVHEAGDGLEALDYISSGKASLDVIVTDIVMPRLDGVGLLRRLAIIQPDLPVVLMSGYGTDQLAERGIASPCAVLSKPFPPERLVAEVRRCIGERK
jgi:two-component system, cell cycle sensor histidine kinase and response regulator CckA